MRAGVKYKWFLENILEYKQAGQGTVFIVFKSAIISKFLV